MTVPAETPFGSALARMEDGARCAVETVLECPGCRRVFPDETGARVCGACRHEARYYVRVHPGPLRRRARRPGETPELAFRA